MEGENGRELHEVLQRAWQAKYGSRGQGPPTDPEMKKKSHNPSNTVARRWRFYCSSGGRTSGGLVQDLAG